MGEKMSVKDRYNLESGQKNMLITVLEYTCDMLQTALFVLFFAYK